MTAWTFGGITLTTFGKVTLLDSYLDSPPSRGDDVTIPYRHGAVFARKYYNKKILLLGVTVIGTSASNLESLMDTMRKLFAVRTQQTLSMTLEDATTRTALAVVNESLNFTRLSDKLARVAISFDVHTPYWRLSTDIADNTVTIDASPKAMTVTNPGTIEERDATIILTGPLEDTVITNSTNGCVLTYTGVIASPRVVTISTNSSGEYVATDDLGANVIGNITHSGSAALMVFNTGNNTMSITDDTATTGTVKVTFKAPFL